MISRMKIKSLESLITKLQRLIFSFKRNLMMKLMRKGKYVKCSFKCFQKDHKFQSLTSCWLLIHMLWHKMILIDWLKKLNLNMKVLFDMSLSLTYSIKSIQSSWNLTNHFLQSLKLNSLNDLQKEFLNLRILKLWCHKMLSSLILTLLFNPILEWCLWSNNFKDILSSVRRWNDFKKLKMWKTS